PEALLAPAQEALDSFHGLLAGADLEAEVLAPLADLFDPVTQALAGLDPAAAFAPVQAALDDVRERVLAVLHLDDVTAAATLLRLRVDASFGAVLPSQVLGPLAENRRRYLAALAAASVTATTLAASGRTEVNAAAAQLWAALAPLQAFPAFARSLLAALG